MLQRAGNVRGQNLQGYRANNDSSTQVHNNLLRTPISTPSLPQGSLFLSPGYRSNGTPIPQRTTRLEHPSLSEIMKVYNKVCELQTQLDSVLSLLKTSGRPADSVFLYTITTQQNELDTMREGCLQDRGNMKDILREIPSLHKEIRRLNQKMSAYPPKSRDIRPLYASRSYCQIRLENLQRKESEIMLAMQKNDQRVSEIMTLVTGGLEQRAVAMGVEASLRETIAPPSSLFPPMAPPPYTERDEVGVRPMAPPPYAQVLLERQREKTEIPSINGTNPTRRSPVMGRVVQRIFRT